MPEHHQAVKQARVNQTPYTSPVRRCCATCEILTDDGYCPEYQAMPPVEFLEEPNECPSYEQEIPF